MQVHRSNDIRRLAAVLARTLDRTGDPFAEDPIVTGSPGLARWLGQELASHFGVWANSHFPSVDSWLDDLWARVLPRAEPRWSVDHAAIAAAAALTALGRDGPPRDSDRALHALATHVARAAMAWSVHRADLVASWERGADGGWQATVWRHLVARLGPYHPMAAAHALAAALAGAPAAMPGGVSFFDVDVDPVLLTVLAALDQRCDVTLFRLSPCAEWWADSRRDEAGALAALGTSWAAAERLLLDVRTAPAALDLHEPAEAGSRLQRLKSSWRSLRPTPERGPDDSSFRVRTAPDPAREVGALRDALLARMASDPTLQAHEILVVAPDLDGLSPLISALFGEQLPHRIADRPRRASDPRVDIVSALLTLPGSRLATDDVLDLLALEPVSQRFGLGSEDVAEVRSALAAAGARWGLDAAHRAARGDPPIEAHTLRHAVQRLLLRFALPADDRDWLGLTPREHRLGADAAGGLAAFVDALEDWMGASRRKRPLWAWARDTASALHRFARPGDDDAVPSALRALAERAADARLAWSADLALDEARPWLLAAVDGLRTRAALLGGGVTVARPSAVRGVPARVIAWLGLDANTWPRRHVVPSWDPMSRPRPGDPDPVAADRALVLGSVLCAGDAWWASWCDREPGTSAQRLPSSSLAALIANAQDDGGEDVVVPVYDRPWETAAWESDAPASAPWAVEAALARLDRKADEWTLDPRVEALAEPVIDLDVFVQRLTKPARTFFTQRLAAWLREESDASDRVDRLETEPLERWSLVDRLLRHRRAGRELHALRDTALQSGEWPVGGAGEDLFDEIAEDVEELCAAAQRFLVEPRPPRWASVPIPDGPRVDGWLDALYGSRRVVVVAGRPNEEKVVDAWLRHLVACAVDPQHQTTELLGIDGSAVAAYSFRRVAEPLTELKNWAALGRFQTAGGGCWLPKVSLAMPSDDARLRTEVDKAATYDVDAQRFYNGRILSIEKWRQASKVIEPLLAHRTGP